MSVVPYTPTPWMVLSPAYLQAFHPLPSNGSLYIPYLESQTGTGRRVLLDAHAAQELETSALLVLEEIDRYWQGLPADQRRTPHLLPGLGAWKLDHVFSGMAAFTKDSRRIEIQCRERDARRFSFSWKTPEVEALERVSVQTDPYEIFTDLYGFRKRFPDFRKAVQFAWYFSSLIYLSGQYRPEELGSLTLKTSESAEERPISHDRPPEIPWEEFHAEGEVSFASERSVFETTSGGYREPVAGASVSPAPGECYDVSVTLYRPPARKQTRMPLAQRLAKIWNSIQYRIQS